MNKAKYDFDRLTLIFENTFKTVVKQRAWQNISSDNYNNNKKIALNVFNKVISICDIFLGIALGLNKGSELGTSDIENYLCFPVRFFKKNSISNLPNAIATILENVIGDTFLLGLTYHLLLTNLPSRCFIERVDLNKLAMHLAKDSLIAVDILKEYNTRDHELPLILFKSFYSSEVEPKLKKDLKIGFWSLGKCDAYFTNLFFSGIFLGTLFDFMTTT